MEPFQKYHLIIFKQLKIPSRHHSIFLELAFMDNLPISMLLKPLIRKFNYRPGIWHTPRCFFSVGNYLNPELYFVRHAHLLVSDILACIIILVRLFQRDFHLKVWHLEDVFLDFFLPCFVPVDSLNEGSLPWIVSSFLDFVMVIFF